MAGICYDKLQTVGKPFKKESATTVPSNRLSNQIKLDIFSTIEESET